MIWPQAADCRRTAVWHYRTVTGPRAADNCPVGPSEVFFRWSSPGVVRARGMNARSLVERGPPVPPAARPLRVDDDDVQLAEPAGHSPFLPGLLHRVPSALG